MRHPRGGFWGAGIGLGLGSLLAVACGDDGGPSASDAPEASASIVCEKFYACDCDDDVDRYSSEEDCRLEIASDVQNSIDEGEREDLIYDDDCVGRVIDAVNLLDCATLSTLIFDQNLAEMLEEAGCKLYYGERRAGQSCNRLQDSSGDDCERELVCDGNSDRCVAADGQVNEGDDCDDENECEPGLICIDINGGQERKCEDLPVANETCKGTADLCDFDFYCFQSDKTCRRLPNEGEDCAEFPNTIGWSCDQRSVCDQDRNLCEEAPGGGEGCSGKCKEGFACQDNICTAELPLICFTPIFDPTG